MLVVLSLGELDELVVFITGVRSKAISILSTASPIRIPLNELYPQKHNQFTGLNIRGSYWTCRMKSPSSPQAEKLKIVALFQRTNKIEVLKVYHVWSKDSWQTDPTVIDIYTQVTELAPQANTPKYLDAMTALGPFTLNTPVILSTSERYQLPAKGKQTNLLTPVLQVSKSSSKTTCAIAS